MLNSDVKPDPLPETHKISPDTPFSIHFPNIKEGSTNNTSLGATFTQYSVVNCSNYLANKLEITPNDRTELITPLWSYAGFVTGNALSITASSSIKIAWNKFNPDKSLQGIVRDRATFLNCSAEQLEEILNHDKFHKYDLGCLQKVVLNCFLGGDGGWGGKIPDKSLIENTFSKIPTVETIFLVYGTHEGGIFMVERFNKDGGGESGGIEVLDYLAVRGSNDGGDLEVKGYSTMSYYWEEPEETNKVIDKDGWVKTGARGKIVDGKVIVDRNAWNSCF